MALTFDDLDVGWSFTTQARTLTEADIVNFSGVSGDFNPLHTDEEFAASTPYGTRIAHGVLVLAAVTGLRQRAGLFDGTLLAFLEIRSWRFKAPVRPGDTIRARNTVRELKPTSKPDRGIVTMHVEVLCGSDVVQDGEFVLLMRRSGEGDR